MFKKIGVWTLVIFCHGQMLASSIVVKKERKVSVSTLNQEASEIIGEILKTSAELVTSLGTLQTNCLSSLERVLDGETVTKKNASSLELKECVATLKTHNEKLKKAKEDIFVVCDFCIRTF